MQISLRKCHKTILKTYLLFYLKFIHPANKISMGGRKLLYKRLPAPPSGRTGSCPPYRKWLPSQGAVSFQETISLFQENGFGQESGIPNRNAAHFHHFTLFLWLLPVITQKLQNAFFGFRPSELSCCRTLSVPGTLC